MEYVHHLLSVIVPSIITVLVVFIATILYRARRTLLIRKDSNSTYQKAEKIPQENDERFATGKRASWFTAFQTYIAIIIR